MEVSPDRRIKVALSCNYKVAHQDLAQAPIVNRQDQKWAPGDNVNSDRNRASTFHPSTFMEDVTTQQHKFPSWWFQLGNTSITD